MSVSVEYLKQVLSYDPSTGVFTWIVAQWRGSVGNKTIAGHCAANDGYVRICISKRMYLAHRLAWLYIHGRWPAHQIDHINGNKSDNSMANLREASVSQNLFNRPAKGVYRNGKGWNVQVTLDGARKCLGTYKTWDEARAVYLAACENHYGKEWMSRKGIAV